MATETKPRSFLGRYVIPLVDHIVDAASTYEAPRTMKVYNKKAGFVYIFCLGVVITYLCLMLFGGTSVYQQIPADGGLTSLWTDSYSTSYYAAQTSERSTNTYCSATQLNQFDFCDEYSCTASGVTDPIWVEKNWECVYPGLAEASTLTPESFSAYTLVKDVEWQVDDCSALTSSSCATGYTFYDEGTGSCSCRKMTNRFMVGVEDIKVKFRTNMMVSFTPPPYTPDAANYVTVTMDSLETFIVSQKCFQRYGSNAHKHAGTSLCPKTVSFNQFQCFRALLPDFPLRTW